MSKMFCDTNCELWFTVAREFDLGIIKMPYTIKGEQCYYDLGEKTDITKFYNMVEKGAMPTTQALNPQDYISYFEPYLEKGEDILYIHFSHKLSGTFDQMRKAIKELNKKYPKQKITVVDTLSISAGASLLLYEACVMHKEGKSDKEIVKFVENNRQNFTAYFMVNSLAHLKRGGRISSMQAIMGGMLGIKPMLYIDKEGNINSFGKAKGRKKGIQMLVSKIEELGEDVLNHKIAVYHANDEAGAKQIVELLEKKYGKLNNVWVQPIGPTIGSHTGSGVLALGFHCKQR